MKKILFIFIAILQYACVTAANPVTVKISDGLSNTALVSKMEGKLSALLTEINAAQEASRAIDMNKLRLAEDVALSLEMLWENSPFVCADEMIVEHCLTTGTGYQIRNIPLTMKPLPGSDSSEEEYQEAVVSFNKQGEITSFYIAISMNLFMNVVKAKNGDLIDLRRRELILDYVEQFRTSYNQKDIKFLNQVFSDDALVITGKVITQKKGDMRLPDRIEYKKQTKQEYITNLKRVFASNKQIRVTFDEIEVMRHPTNADFYGVTLHQGYSSDRYHDDGYVFLLWDFTDEDAPQIHVRTWQPDVFNGKPLPKDDVFSLGDFDI